MSNKVEAKNPSVDEIVALIVAQVKKPLKKGQEYDSKPFEEWVEKLRLHVKEVLDEGELIWKNAENNVLAVANEMGSIAVMLAFEDKVIDRKRLDAAFQAARAHRRCGPINAAGDVEVLGRWCDFG